MSVKLSMGSKKKSYKSIMAAAAVIANETGEPLQRVYNRLYQRLYAGKKAVTAVNKPAREYNRVNA